MSHVIAHYKTDGELPTHVVDYPKFFLKCLVEQATLPDITYFATHFEKLKGVNRSLCPDLWDVIADLASHDVMCDELPTSFLAMELRKKMFLTSKHFYGHFLLHRWQARFNSIKTATVKDESLVPLAKTLISSAADLRNDQVTSQVQELELFTSIVGGNISTKSKIQVLMGNETHRKMYAEWWPEDPSS